MRILFSLFAAIAVLFATITPVLAQDDDKGFLTRTIQDALSGSGRTVSIDGFQGALSSTASFSQMTIADDDGVWLTLEDVQLVWSRSALLRGRLEVDSLTARRLDVPRLPVAQPDTLPDAEAAPFRLPELPVSVRIAEFAVAEINLGAPILGEAAQLSLRASAELTDDLGDIDLQAQRTDAKRGEFVIKANFERSDMILDLLLRLSEGEDGIAARMLNIPGQPSVDLAVQGSGPLDTFAADVTLATEAQERLAGQVILGTQAPRRPSDTPDRRIQADIGGDITALLAPRYREFFGQDLRLTVDALLESTGAVEVSAFALNARAATFEGKLALNQDRWPTFIDIKGRVAGPDGLPVLLPLGGEASMVDNVILRVDYDAANGDAIDAAFDISGLTRSGLSIGHTGLGLTGRLQGNAGSLGQFLGDLRFDAQRLTLTDRAMSEAIGDQITGKATIAYTQDQPIEISALDIAGADYALTGDAVIEALETGLRTQLDAAVQASDLSRFSALAGRELNGSTALSVTGQVVPLSGQFDLAAQGMTEDLALGIVQADAVLAGRTEVSLSAKRDETGTFLRDLVLSNAALNLTGGAQLRTGNSRADAQVRLADIALVLPQYKGPVTVTAIASQDASGWTIDTAADGPYGAALTAKGLATGPDAALTFTADIPDVAPFAAQIEGPVSAKGLLSQSPQGWQIKTEATGPYRLSAALDGLVAPRLDVRFDISLPDLQPLVPQVNGPLAATGTVLQTDQGFVIDTSATGPFGAKALVEGLATGPQMQLTFDVSMPNVNPLVPGVSGPLAAKGVLRQTPDGIVVDTNASGPYSATASVQGLVTGPRADVAFSLGMPNIGALVSQVNGPLSVDGTARKQGQSWRLDTDATGPAGTQARVAGLVDPGGVLNLAINGTAPLGLSRPFLAPRDLQGQARFDLRVNGPAALSSVSGSIQTDNASFSAPNLRLTLEGIAADIRLANSAAALNVTARAVNGGQLRAAGSVGLTSGLGANIDIALNELVLIDPRLYRSSVSGNLRLSGPLAGGAGISGQINVGETTITVPSTGLTSIGDIPPITHVGAVPDVIATRRKAGLDSEVAGTETARAQGPGYGLNLRVNAPNRLFVRGRGLDAELGGGLTLTGSTNRIISAGRFNLLRGRLDILGKRFDLREGSTQFQGDLVPFIRFVSASSTSAGEVRVIVEGPADAPKVRFESTPEAPQDEVLAQLLFGRDILEISPFQALQLANAVATLAGREGAGVITNLRAGFGLDDLDVTTTDSGATAVRAGKYISENIYTDVTAASDGTGEVSLNLDITSSLKGKATLGSDGNSGIGIFFEKDY